MADYDVIIIGAGGGGPVAAKELAEQGLRVLQLEAGGYARDPERDYTHSEADMTNPVSGTFRFGPSDRTRGPWLRRMDGAGLIQQVSGVGGTTQHYFANSPRAYPLAVQEGGWPHRYADLVPYYERVETILPVIRDPKLPTKDAWALYGAHRLGLPQIMGKDVHHAGWRPQYNAILPPGYAGPGTGCNQCGHCYEGCMHPHGAGLAAKAKRGTQVSYVPLAESHSGYELEVDAFATKILTAAEGGETVAKGVRWRNTRTGEEKEATAQAVILAAGCVESPRLWLNSELPNATDSVGRNLTLHWFDFVTGYFPFAIHPAVGQNSQSRIEFPGYGCLEVVGLGAGKTAFGTMTFSNSWAGDDNSAGEPWDTRGHVVGRALRERMRAHDRTLTLLVLTDDEIHRDNRVTVDPTWPPDEHGMVPRVRYAPTARSDARRDWLCRKAAEILRAAGATDVHRADWPPLYLHLQSSMRMGATPDNSVVDANQESWEVKRLFVCDASSLPDGLGGPNPTLTTQMFATRTAEHIAVTYFDRDPFVLSGTGRTTPAGFAEGEDVTPGENLPEAGGGQLAGGAGLLAAGGALHQIMRRR